MNSQELEPKYSYRFAFNPNGGEAQDEEAPKAEIQANINELLGIKKEESKQAR